MSKSSFNLAAGTAGHIRLPDGLIINYTLLIISGKNFHYVHSSPGRYMIICKKKKTLVYGLAVVVFLFSPSARLCESCCSRRVHITSLINCVDQKSEKIERSLLKVRASQSRDGNTIGPV